VRDIVERLLDNGYELSVRMEAADEIVWLRKEAKMWRLRATQAASAPSGAAEPAVDGEVRQTQP
jgi:hypothetical protein